MHPEEPGDTYLDDGLHYTLSVELGAVVTEKMEQAGGRGGHACHGEWWWAHRVPPDVLPESAALAVLRARLDTAADREEDEIVKTLAREGLPDRTELARGLQGLSAGPATSAVLLAVALTHGQLDALRIACTHSPRPRADWRRFIPLGHHSRHECLERSGEWCAAPHPGRCDSCPSRRHEARTAERMVCEALELRRGFDAVMWAARP